MNKAFNGSYKNFLENLIWLSGLFDSYNAASVCDFIKSVLHVSNLFSVKNKVVVVRETTRNGKGKNYSYHATQKKNNETSLKNCL